MPTFQQRLLRHLDQNKRYPQTSQRRRQQGTAMLRFTMDADGNVLSFRLEKTSGYEALDDEVLAMIKRAEPLPKIPADLGRDRLELVVPEADIGTAQVTLDLQPDGSGLVCLNGEAVAHVLNAAGLDPTQIGLRAA